MAPSIHLALNRRRIFRRKFALMTLIFVSQIEKTSIAPNQKYRYKDINLLTHTAIQDLQRQMPSRGSAISKLKSNKRWTRHASWKARPEK